jgi:hypothetical protein
MTEVRTVKKRSYRAAAKRRWPTVEWIKGDGPWAFVTPCDPGITISLWPTRDAAMEKMKTLGYCCSECWGLHYHFIARLRPKTHSRSRSRRPSRPADGNQ